MRAHDVTGPDKQVSPREHGEGDYETDATFSRLCLIHGAYEISVGTITKRRANDSVCVFIVSVQTSVNEIYRDRDREREGESEEVRNSSTLDVISRYKRKFDEFNLTRPEF